MTNNYRMDVGGLKSVKQKYTYTRLDVLTCTPVPGQVATLGDKVTLWDLAREGSYNDIRLKPIWETSLSWHLLALLPRNTTIDIFYNSRQGRTRECSGVYTGRFRHLRFSLNITFSKN